MSRTVLLQYWIYMFSHQFDKVPWFVRYLIYWMSPNMEQLVILSLKGFPVEFPENLPCQYDDKIMCVRIAPWWFFTYLSPLSKHLKGQDVYFKFWKYKPMIEPTQPVQNTRRNCQGSRAKSNYSHLFLTNRIINL